MTVDEKAIRIIVALMGKCPHKWQHTGTGSIHKCILCGLHSSPNPLTLKLPYWSPSDSDGRMTYEVMDFMQDRLPEVWQGYLDDINEYHIPDNATCIFEAQHLLKNLASYLRDHMEFAWEECLSPPDGRTCFDVCHSWTCNHHIPVPKWAGFVKYVREEEK